MIDAVQLAAQKLADGQLIGLPTETVYGLAADARNPAAVRQIYELKNRPITHPLITHIAADADVFAWVNADALSERTRAMVTQLIAAFWPGPLTLVLPKAAHIDATVTGGQDTIALRSPNHPLAQAVLHEMARILRTDVVGIAAPSANHFGRVSPTRAAHVRDEFGDAVWVLDGDVSDVGIESTIVDLTRGEPMILRLGAITADDIERVTGVWPLSHAKGDAPRVSGTMLAHYAPRTPLVWASAYRGGAVAACLAHSPDFDVSGFKRHIQLPNHAVGYAQGLYHALRELDTAHAACIVVEDLPADPRWAAIADRLKRAVVGSNESTHD
ncbi:MAG: L-threonylcarbamoyladenylate synthase [Formosimonas sp.]